MRMAECHTERKYLALGLCSPCYRKRWYRENIEYVKEYRKENEERDRANDKRWREKNKEFMKEYHKKYYEENKERIQESRKNYTKSRRAEDINFRIAGNLRSRMYSALRQEQKSGSAVRDLGCSIPTFRLYIENQFDDGMAWDNYGEWHLDHVIPLASFDLANRTQFLEAANWLNYQPLWAKDNIRKGSK